MRRECFEAIGGFSEHFPHWGADVDLCFKLKRNGTPAYFTSRISVVHSGIENMGVSVSRDSAIVIREAVFRFFEQNFGRGTAITYRGAMVLNSLVRLVLIPPMLPLGKVFVRHGLASWRKWCAILHWGLRT